MRIARFVLSAVVAVAMPVVASNTLRPAGATAQTPPPTSDPLGGLIDSVQRATVTFRDLSKAKAAGYAPFLGCVTGPQDGAMGLHFVNSDYVKDGELDVNHPEALIYEPDHGDYHLVGVEYIVMADAWQAHHPEPPVLGGQLFQFNGSPNRYGLPAFYELHVWAWRDNPSGAFVDWNPHVMCGH